MGLDFSHGDAHWSYSGFKYFRETLWNLAGFPGALYDLYAKGDHKVAIDHPLWSLFNHSDCDGNMTVKQMKLVEPELRRLSKHMESYDRNHAIRLCDGMRLAIEENKPLRFQ